MREFLQLWENKTKCWLCDNMAIVTSTKALVQEMQTADIPLTEDRQLTTAWADTCVSGYLLALFATTRSAVVQTWRFYDFNLKIVETCGYDEAVFHEMFKITPTQMAYVFYLLVLAFHLPDRVLPLQGPEFRHAAEVGMGEAPLVIDIGMGLGADSRYYLSQGFRVAAVEANLLSIQAALTVDWVKPLVLSGRLSFLHAAVAPPGTGGGTLTLFSLPYRPEQSTSLTEVAEGDGEPVAVRTIECADLLRLYGRAAYMKMDIESNTADCLASLYHTHKLDAEAAHPLPNGARLDAERGEKTRPLELPALLSLELEASSLGPRFLKYLQGLGYVSYKICRQYVYSPAPCEQIGYDTGVLGCGSGPFGEAAVDYRRGVRWNPLAELENDTEWVDEFEGGLDWFDLHAKLRD